MMAEIPIAKPRGKPGNCQQCGIFDRYTYVKTKHGFRRVCMPCAHKMRDEGMLVMPDRVIPMGKVF